MTVTLLEDTLYLLSLQCHSCVSASARVNAGTDNFLHRFYGTHSSLHVFNRGPYVGTPDLSLKLLELVGSHGVSLSSPLQSKGQEESSLSGRASEWREGVGGGGRGRGGGRRGWGGFGDITGVVHHRLDNNNIERKRCLNVSRPSQESVNVVCPKV